MKYAFLRATAAAIALCSLATTPAIAGEGAGSHYMPGTGGDFAMALIGPAGFYLRNDLVYFQGDMGPVTLGNRIYASASQDVWVDTVKGIYLAEGGLFGGRFGAVVSLPIVIDDALGEDKWAIGPAFGFAVSAPRTLWGVFNQNVFTFAGDGKRADVDLSIIQPILNILLPGK